MVDFDSRFVELIHTYQIDLHHPWFYEKVRVERLLKVFWRERRGENKGKTLTLLYEKEAILKISACQFQMKSVIEQ